MKLHILVITAAISFTLLASEARAIDQNTLIKHIVKSLQHQYAPDRRTSVFKISHEQRKSKIVFFGEVDDVAAKNALIDTLRKNLKQEIIDSIRVLPDVALGNYCNGIVITDVGDVRYEPHRQGELITQVTMGTIVKLLKRTDGYYFIQMPDQYLGWIDTASLYLTDQTGVKTWNTAHKVIVTELTSTIHKTPDSSLVPLCTVVAGCILKSGDRNDEWTMVELANGQKGFILNLFIQDLNEWEKSRLLTGENLEKTAKMLLGTPYLWGGTSVKGMDCSGFIKIVYRFNGMELHRDADQQADQGTLIDPGKNFENLQNGDLIFFGPPAKEKQSKRVTHVGLSIGNKLFIHSAGRVRLSSLDSLSKYFEASLLSRFVLARRIIQK